MESKQPETIESLLEDEWYIVRNSGEIPEIAYNASIYFLERAKDGPQARLSAEQKRLLQQAALDRCEEIVLRDMLHENVGTPIYRGIARSICNYDRYLKFCCRQQLTDDGLREKAAQILSVFLQQEYQNVSKKATNSVINCTFPELKEFAVLLGVSFPDEYQILEPFCLQ